MSKVFVQADCFALCVIGPVAKLLDWRDRRAELEADDNPFAAFVLAQLDTLETKGDMEDRAARKLALMKALVRRNITKQDIREMMRLVAWLMRVPSAIFEPYCNEFIAFTRGKAMPFEDDFDYFGRKKDEMIGLQRGIKLALSIKFGAPGLEFANSLRDIDDMSKLNVLENSLPAATSIDELKILMGRRGNSSTVDRQFQRYLKSDSADPADCPRVPVG